MMTNEQLYILLSAYRDELLQINGRHDPCSGDSQAFTHEIEALADRIQNDMLVLRPLPKLSQYHKVKLA